MVVSDSPVFLVIPVAVQVDELVNDSYNKNLRKDLEDYCDTLFDGEEMEE